VVLNVPLMDVDHRLIESRLHYVVDRTSGQSVVCIMLKLFSCKCLKASIQRRAVKKFNLMEC